MTRVVLAPPLANQEATHNGSSALVREAKARASDTVRLVWAWAVGGGLDHGRGPELQLPSSETVSEEPGTRPRGLRGDVEREQPPTPAVSAEHQTQV